MLINKKQTSKRLQGPARNCNEVALNIINWTERVMIWDMQIQAETSTQMKMIIPEVKFYESRRVHSAKPITPTKKWSNPHFFV